MGGGKGTPGRGEPWKLQELSMVGQALLDQETPETPRETKWPRADRDPRWPEESSFISVFL